jgi:predicted transcriptional regulator
VATVAATLPVGLSLARPVVCVAYDAPLRVAAHALVMEPSAYGVAVVDDVGRLVGILPRATATLALLRSAADAATEHMSIDWCAVDESDTLGEAFGTMTARRARELSVVGEGRAVVGTLRDIDALRFVSYVSRTGLRPPVDRAA